ncbi:putative inorganic carbon transporter subunit DabA [Gimesia sp.]|uniref:putative inorganic carbon transporter subunit DabA n=1 Tax=Gimesia sp. TaxID=2024833 RepID=UPI0032EF4146
MSQKKSESTYFPLPTLLNRYSPAQVHLVEHLSEALHVVSRVISSVTPIKDQVAVNPYHGICERSFLNARKYLRIFSDYDTLMPLEFYAEEFHSGRFGIEHIQSAIEELENYLVGTHHIPSAKKIAERLQKLADNVDNQDRAPDQLIQQHNRPVRTLSELLDQNTNSDWSELIYDEISKYCAMHYDQGEAIWPSPWKELTLYQSWRSASVYDRNLEFRGLSGLRRYISQLPHTPEISIISSLKSLKVPPVLWETYLLCQAFSIHCWSARIKCQAIESGIDDLSGLLAIRLAYDAALSRAQKFEIDWSEYPSKHPISFKSSTSAHDDELLRYTLLRASEIAFRDQLLRGLTAQTDNTKVVSESTGKSSAIESDRTERMPVSNSYSMIELSPAAGAWSKAGPECELAGKPAFVIASQKYIRENDLEANTFLCSYDHSHDPEGIVLENIMTAPMIFAHCKNMQSYASAVDNHQFGSSNLNFQNVLGGMGILSDKRGDLTTGSPWQSLQTGSRFDHKPIRLHIVIAAPRYLIEKIISKHPSIMNLLSGNWMHLVSLDEEQALEYSTDGIWKKIVLPEN